MHEDDIGVAGVLHHLVVDPVGSQQLGPLRDQLLLSHGGPDVRVEHIRPFQIVDIVGQLNMAPVFSPSA